MVGLSARIGGTLEERVAYFRSERLLLVFATLLATLLVLGLLRRMATRRGRALLRASWRRTVRFEYWPPWVLYVPVALYVVGLALRFRSLRVFTAANPAFPCGGLVGESKGAILRELARASDRVPPTEGIPAALTARERLELLRRFQERHGLSFPIVLKPDVGERGRGVLVARSRDDAARALENARGDLLVQAFVEGPEFGLFYARRPDEPRGRILSITEKHLPRVVGDGVRSLEELILADERTLPMYRFFLEKEADRLAWVPAANESVSLGDLGSHCRGATFLDGAHLATPALEAAVDALSRSFPGFFFGRYDVRSASVAELAEGRFLVLELNGVTSEVTHVYDPRHSVFAAWRALLAQWQLAFEIGDANARVGARVSSWAELGRAVLDHFRRTRRRGPTAAVPREATPSRPPAPTA